jgi:hypothetical protein
MLLSLEMTRGGFEELIELLRPFEPLFNEMGFVNFEIEEPKAE